MEYCDSCPKEGVKVLPVTKTSVGVTEHAAKQLHAEDTTNKVKLIQILNLANLFPIPENEYEERQEAKKHNNIVHSSQHNHKLSLKSRKESDKLQDSEQSECPQDCEA